MFSIRIVTADHYVSHPISSLDTLQSSQPKVPVIRIFGATPAGQKTCMHVHGVFPYIYVPYDGTQPWNTYLQQFAASLDKAINIAAGNSNANTKHVYKINLVSGISMYGYHQKEELFLKIYFYNPNVIKKVADLLLGGAVFNKVFQPHEAHIPYLLQMFIDYNLYGMNLLHVSHAKFRRCKEDCNTNLKLEENKDKETNSENLNLFRSRLDNDIHNRKWDINMIPQDLLLANSVQRQSTCELEVDVVAADILNRKTIDTNNAGANPGLVAIWEDEKQRRRIRKESSQIGSSPSQERNNSITASNEETLKCRLKTIIQFHQFNHPANTNVNKSLISSPYLPYASIVEYHSSNSLESLQPLPSSSQSTIELENDPSEKEDDESVATVVNVDCVHQVVESSQSFRDDSSQSAASNVTKMLASLLASQGSNTSLSQNASFITNEEHDSILLSQPTSHEDDDDDEEEREMSQVFSDDLTSQPLKQHIKEENFNVPEGFGSSWDGSMVSDDSDSDSHDVNIPQFDGPIDEKSAEDQPKIRKRLGTRGPVTTSGNNPSPIISENQPSNYSSYGSMYQNEPSYMPPNAGMQGYHQNPSNYPDYDRRWDSIPFREEMTGGLSAVDQQSSHWSHGWSRSLHSPRGDPSAYPGGGNNGSYMTEGFSRPYPNQQPPPPPPPPPPQQQVGPMSDSAGDQYSNPYSYDMGNMYSPETYSRSARSSTEGGGHTPDARNSPFAGHLSPSPGYSRDGFETSRSPVPLSGNVGNLQGSGGGMYNQTPPLPHPDESQGSFHKLLTCSDSPKQTSSADISTHQSLQRSISRCSTHSSESMSMGASTTPDPFKNMVKPVTSEETSLETFEKLPNIDKVDETAEGRSSVDSSNHPPSETGNASLTPLESNSSSQKKRVTSLNMSHEDLFGSPSLNSCADLSSDSFTSAEGSRHPTNVDPSSSGGYMTTGYTKNSTHAQRCSSVTSEEEAPSYQSLTMPFTGNRSGNRSHSAMASLEQMVSSVGGYDMSGYDYPAYANRTWQCASPQGPHNVPSLHSMPPGPGPNMPQSPNMPPGPNMNQAPNMPQGLNMTQGPNMSQGPNMPPGPNMSQGPNMPPGPNMSQVPNMPPGPNMSQGPNMPPGPNMPNMSQSPNMPPGPNMAQGSKMPPGPNMSQGANMPPGPNMSQGANMPSGQNMSQGPNMSPNQNMSQGPNMPPGQNLSQGPNMPPGSNMSQGSNMPPSNLPSSSNITPVPNMPPNQTITQNPQIPSNQNLNPGQTIGSGPNIPPGSNLSIGANMSPRSNLHPGHSLPGRSHTTGHSIPPPPPMSSGHSLAPHNIPPHSMQSGPNMNMSQNQHLTQGRGITQGMSHNLHSGHGLAHNLTSHAHTMPPQGHNVHTSHSMTSNPTLAPPPSHTMATAPTTAQGHSMSSSHNMMQSHNLPPQSHPMTQGHDRPHSYNLSEQGYQQQDPVTHKQGRLSMKKKRPDPDNWSYTGNSYYQQQSRTWNHPTGPPGQNYGNPSYWSYMDSYSSTYQNYPPNPKVDQTGVCSMQKPPQMINPGMPMEKSKRGRKRSSFTMAKCTPSLPLDPQASRYTYTFHVPTPIYKRLKFLQKSSITEENAVCIVRMHPMDARRYSLLKIGRELVKVPKLEAHDIERIQDEIKALGPSGENRDHLVPSQGLDSHLLLTSESMADVDDNEISVGKKMLPLASKAASKSAPSGFQLEYERMLLQNHPRVSEKSLQTEMDLAQVNKANERPPPPHHHHRRMRMRTNTKRKRQSPVKLKDYTDHPFAAEGSIISGLLSSEGEKFPAPGSQFSQQYSHPSPTGMVKTQLTRSPNLPPENPALSSKKAESTSTITTTTTTTLMPIRSTPHVRRSTRPFPKQEIVSSLMGSSHLKTAGSANYGNERFSRGGGGLVSGGDGSGGRGSIIGLHPPSHASGPIRNSGPDSGCLPMPSSCINNTKPVMPSNLQSEPITTCKENKDEVDPGSQPDSFDEEPSRKSFNSCKEQPAFQGYTSPPNNSSPPSSGGPSSWQSNNTSGGGIGSNSGQFTYLSTNHNTQQEQQHQRKRKFCPDNGNTYKEASNGFTALNLNGIYDSHLDDDDGDDDIDYADDDDDDYVVDEDDEDDDDDDDDDGFIEKAGSNVCCLVVNKRARRKSLVVKLEKLNLPSKSVKASEFLASHNNGRRRRRVCTGNKISRRMENVGWDNIQLVNKNKQRRGGLPLVRFSGSLSSGGGNGRLDLFTRHTEDLYYERPTIDYFQDEYLGVSITGTVDEAGETGLLMSLDDDSYSRITNTDSSSGEDATISTEEEFEMKSRGKNKRKRNLTPNQRLGVAFLTTRHRRKKAVPLNHGKLMNSLSLLHQATLAKLTDTSATYTDTSDDFKKTYNDVMSKLAMFSPPVSEKGDTSPPQPLSPEENGVLGTIESHEEDVQGNFGLDCSNDARSILMCQTSVDSIYETPLSSVETQRSCESAKSPGLTSLGGSETEQLPEAVLPATAAKLEDSVENKQPPSFSSSSFSSSSKKSEPPLEKSPYAVKTAVVKLIPRTRSGAKCKTDHRAENGINDSESGPPNMARASGGQKFDEFGDVVVDMEHSVQNSVWLNSNDMSPFNQSSAQGSRPFSDCASINSPPRPCNNSFGQSRRNSFHTGQLISSPLNPYSSPPCSNPLVADKSDKASLHGIAAAAAPQEELNCDSHGIVIDPPLGNLSESCCNRQDECSHQRKPFPPPGPTDGTVSKRNQKTEECAKIATTNSSWIATFHDEESRSGFADSESSRRSESFLSSVRYNRSLPGQSNPNPQDTATPSSNPQWNRAGNNDQQVRNEIPENGGNCLNDQNKRDQSEGESRCFSSSLSSSLSSSSCKVADKSVVLRPRNSPPSKDSICQTAATYGLSLSQVIDPFYGRPEDITDTPRELGGRVLTLQTHLLKDLSTFNSVLESGESLQNWRFILATNQGIVPTEEDVTSLNKLFMDPAIHCNLVGNKKRVMTPCLPPPNRKSVALYGDQLSCCTLLAPTKEAGSVLGSKDESVKIGPNYYPATDDSELLPILPSLSCSSLTLLPSSPESPPQQQVEEESSQEEERQTPVNNPSKPESSSPLSSKLFPGNDYRMHSTPVRNKLLSVPAPMLTPITSNYNKEKTNVQEKDDPQPSTSKAVNPRTTTLRKQLANKGIKQWTPREKMETSQIEGPTPKNPFGFKFSQLDVQGSKSNVEVQHICSMSLEMHMQNRGKQNPDPEFDAIQAMFIAISEDSNPSKHHLFIIVVDPNASRKKNSADNTGVFQQGPSQVKGLLHYSVSPKDSSIIYVFDELELISELEGLVQKWDPDILVGFEISMMSWGYLLERAAHLNIELASRISRIPGSKPSTFNPEDVDINLPGRIVLNLWRIMKYEVNLNIYTLENVVFHVLHQRIPRYSYHSLTTWFNHKTHLHRWRVVEYFLFRSKANLMLMDEIDLIGKTSEFARVFGIEFYHVLSRGSQYRVESMMLRIAKPLNFLAVSPSVHQRSKMKAPECIPLNLEPESRFYCHPVVVLDFQSLYPSIMIAYNYCFSTCLGRIENMVAAHEGPIEFGCTHLNVPPSLLKELENDVSISPNGVVFVKEHIRKGIISRMVEDILNTRIMVKKSMKKCKDKALHKMLNARQLGLKLIANVTYGYTGANFSGRMPCIEVADSIVRKARETLEKAIHLIEETPEWGAKVIYGDTDSVFVLLKGRSKEAAIRLGQQMADVITANNPKPVKLKFEKVYLPCVLQTKKRYFGYMYETEEQKEPVFDAKGIETVRRDGCAATSKILERSIKILFSSRDVSRVKDYVLQQCHKIMEGQVNLKDFIFAKEYRGLNAYRPAACVPALEIAKKLLRTDRRAEPQSGERVPYVIVYGEPGLPLIQLVRQPWEVLEDATLRLNAAYYITKQILPPLSRIFSLMGCNVFKWYADMPKVIRYATNNNNNNNNKTTISHYFNSMSCLVCKNQSQENICRNCESQPQMLAVTIHQQIRQIQQIHQNFSQICHSCRGPTELSSSCISLDCPILYHVKRAENNLKKLPTLHEILLNI